MKRLLIIPHVPTQEVRVRELALAHSLTRFYKVYYLIWAENKIKNRWRKILFFISQFFGKEKAFKKDGIVFIELASILYWPRWLAKHYNAYQLARMIKKYSIKRVLNGNAFLFPIKKSASFRYIYDLVDDHIALCSQKTRRFVKAFIETEIEKADKVISVSLNLLKKVASLKKETFFIPNGASIDNFRKISPAKIKYLQQKYHLENKFVLGYIGNHGPWSNLEFLIQVFREFKLAYPQSVLLIVGPGVEVERLRKKVSPKEDIIFTGPILPSEIVPYFQVLHLGVLPSIKNSFRDNAIPIKALEYGAARKIVLSSPLEGLISLNLPYIFFANLNLREWLQKLEKIMTFQWEKAWDKEIEKYDWRKITQRLYQVIEE
jgi:glycosyltransferase involved in cell wall biosynthesis